MSKQDPYRTKSDIPERVGTVAQLLVQDAQYVRSNTLATKVKEAKVTIKEALERGEDWPIAIQAGNCAYSLDIELVRLGFRTFVHKDKGIVFVEGVHHGK